MSYLTADPGRITAVDLNHAHIALGRLKLAAARHLPSHRHFANFLRRSRPISGSNIRRSSTPMSCRHLGRAIAILLAGPRPAGAQAHRGVCPRLLPHRLAGTLHRREPCALGRLAGVDPAAHHPAPPRPGGRSSSNSSTRRWRRCSITGCCAGCSNIPRRFTALAFRPPNMPRLEPAAIPLRPAGHPAASGSKSSLAAFR